MTYSRREFARYIASAAALAGLASCGSASKSATTSGLATAASTTGPEPAVATPPTLVPEPTMMPESTVVPEATEASPTPTAATSPEPTTAAPPSFPTGIEPERIEIPAIGVDAPVIELDLRGDEPEVPTDFADVGWYTQTRLPGEIGPAVLAGHIDSRTGPAVFYRLDQLVAGDSITVTNTAGETRSFSVTNGGQYTKETLPPEVFNVTGTKPDLRLITCGGTFDNESGHYRDNFVVYASAL